MQRQQENNVPEPLYDLPLLIFLFTASVTFESWWFIPSVSQLDQQNKESSKNNIHLKMEFALIVEYFIFTITGR